MKLLLRLSLLVSAAAAFDDMTPWDRPPVDYDYSPTVDGSLPPNPNLAADKAAFEKVEIRETLFTENTIMNAILNNPEKLKTAEGLVSLCYEDLVMATKDEGSEVFKAAVHQAEASYPEGIYFLCYSAPLAKPLAEIKGKMGLNRKIFDGNNRYNNGHGILTEPCASTPGHIPHFYGYGNSWIDGGFTAKEQGVKSSAYIKVPNFTMDEFRDISRIKGVSSEFGDIWMGVAGFVTNVYQIRFIAFPLRNICTTEETEEVSSLRGAVKEE